jgi:NAD(P)-dependent dehydrogenase (short-subunit alcohol dehydrogenase family)
MADSKSSDYLNAVEITVGAAAELVNAAHDLLRNAVRTGGDASVINISSMYGMVSPDPRIYGRSGMNNPPHYGAAKAALLQYTRYAAVHLAPEGIRVNAISPGAFPPEAAQQRDPAFTAALTQKVPMGRLGRPEDMAGAIVFLASSAARFVTGANLPIDGGWTAW